MPTAPEACRSSTSHHLEDVLDVCDTVTIMRDGAVVAPSVLAAEVTVDKIVRHMLGDKVVAPIQTTARGPGRRRRPDPTARPDQWPGQRRRAGHRTLLSVVSGVRRPDAGTVTLPDSAALKSGMRGAIAQGVAIVSGEEMRFGVMMDKPIWENNIRQVRTVARTGPWVDTRARDSETRPPAGGPARQRPAGGQGGSELSGGNEQKVASPSGTTPAPP